MFVRFIILCNIFLLTEISGSSGQNTIVVHKFCTMCEAEPKNKKLKEIKEKFVTNDTKMELIEYIRKECKPLNIRLMPDDMYNLECQINNRSALANYCKRFDFIEPTIYSISKEKITVCSKITLSSCNVELIINDVSINEDLQTVDRDLEAIAFKIAEIIFKCHKTPYSHPETVITKIYTKPLDSCAIKVMNPSGNIPGFVVDHIIKKMQFKTKRQQIIRVETDKDADAVFQLKLYRLNNQCLLEGIIYLKKEQYPIFSKPHYYSNTNQFSVLDSISNELFQNYFKLVEK